jgi:hypothetical protein
LAALPPPRRLVCCLPYHGRCALSHLFFKALANTNSASPFGAGLAGLPPKPVAVVKAGPDFEAARQQGGARPGVDKHDGFLPQNYLDLLPPAARAAFEAAAFEWGNVPEMVPPIELR